MRLIPAPRKRICRSTVRRQMAGPLVACLDNICSVVFYAFHSCLLHFRINNNSQPKPKVNTRLLSLFILHILKRKPGAERNNLLFLENFICYYEDIPTIGNNAKPQCNHKRVLPILLFFGNNDDRHLTLVQGRSDGQKPQENANRSGANKENGGIC
jgi:hypothetical protein